MTMEDIFRKQIELNERINPDLYEVIKDPAKRRSWFIRFSTALSLELSEAIESLNWKWWKKEADNWDNVKIELVDVLHFWVSMCTIAGMDWQDVMNLYEKKSRLNHKRQEEGYKEGTYKKTINGVEDNEQLMKGNN